VQRKLFFARSLLAYLVASYLGDTVQGLGKLRVTVNGSAVYPMAIRDGLAGYGNVCILHTFFLPAWRPSNRPRRSSVFKLQFLQLDLALSLRLSPPWPPGLWPFLRSDLQVCQRFD
jgi:hypothetical protein